MATDLFLHGGREDHAIATANTIGVRRASGRGIVLTALIGAHFMATTNNGQTILGVSSSYLLELIGR